MLHDPPQDCDDESAANQPQARCFLRTNAAEQAPEGLVAGIGQRTDSGGVPEGVSPVRRRACRGGEVAHHTAGDEGTYRRGEGTPVAANEKDREEDRRGELDRHSNAGQHTSPRGAWSEQQAVDNDGRGQQEIHLAEAEILGNRFGECAGEQRPRGPPVGAVNVAAPRDNGVETCPERTERRRSKKER